MNRQIPRLLPMLVKNGLADWSTVLEGIRRNLIEPSEVAVYAANLASELGNSPFELIELAGADNEPIQRIEQLISTLASSEEVSLGEVVDRIRLARLLALRCGIEDEDSLLRAVAEAYSDFGYPADMASAVYYMPSNGVTHADIGDMLEPPIAALDRLIANLKIKLGCAKNRDD